MNQISDEKILELFQNKNTKSEAFTLLINQFQERLYWHVRKIVLSHDDTDDILQETFLRAWRALDRFRGDSQLSTWLYKIATNRAFTFLKEKKKRYYLFDNQSAEEILLGSLTSEEYFDEDKLAIELQKAILNLPEKQRIVFNMKYFDEMKYEDMSEILETSVGALKASYHHAVSKIKTMVKTEYFRL